MKLRHVLALMGASAITPLAFGSVYVSNFTGYSVGDPLNGVDGWVQSEVDPEGPLSPLSWVSSHAGQLAGTVGANYNVPTSVPYQVTRSIGVPLVGSSLQMRFGIQDSTTAWAYRNNFYISVADGATNLFSMNFVNTAQAGDYDVIPTEANPNTRSDPATANTAWNMNWSSGAITNDAFAAIYEDGSYTLDLSFVQVGSDVQFTLDVSGPLNSWSQQTGTLTGVSLSANFGELQIGVDQADAADWGNNFFAFQGIPEPTCAALLGLASLGLLIRRRR